MTKMKELSAAEDLLKFTNGRKYTTIYADPPWQFSNRTGKIAPEYTKMMRYPTMTLKEIEKLPVKDIAADDAHLYLWIPNAILPEGLEVMKKWGFEYKANLIWEKIRQDGEPDGSGVGFYFRNVTEILLFGTKTRNKSNKFRTLPPARTQVNLLREHRQEHSRKPDEFAELIEKCSPGPYIELFARGIRKGWTVWGNQADGDYSADWLEGTKQKAAIVRASSKPKK